jgi:small subunit ribosomal protein S9
VSESPTPEDQAKETPATSPAESEPAPAEVATVAAPAEKPAGADVSQPAAAGMFWGTGRRKRAVARVRLVPGEGKVLINRRTVEEYFQEPQEQAAVHEPLIATNTTSGFDVFVNVRGGGHSGQADAIRLGVARALVKADNRHESALREKGYLTRDARVVERKKYGQRKARRRFQFSKR